MTGVADEVEPHAVEALAAAAGNLLEDGDAAEALSAIVAAVAAATRADLVIARTVSAAGDLVARAVQAASPALAAELEGTRLPAADVPEAEGDMPLEALPEGLRRAGERARAGVVHVYPVHLEGRPVATLELFRADGELTQREEMLARLACAHLGLAVRLQHEPVPGNGGREAGTSTLELFGEVLAAGADERETAEHVVRLAAEATRAGGAALWRIEADTAPTFLAAFGLSGRMPRGEGVEQALSAVRERSRGLVARTGDEADGTGTIATLPLGEPPVAALQLYFDDGGPADESLDLLSPFAARAALALRRSRRVGLILLALRRSQTVIGVVSQAIAQLSLAHTLETAVERIAELTGSEHVGIYLREGGGLAAAAARGLEDDVDLADRLLELALGPFRGRGFVFIEDMRSDPRLRGLEASWEETGIRRALFIPLVVHDEVIGALGVFKTRVRPYREGEEGLLLALSSQLAVAVQNARLHERAKELGERLERTLDSERRAARQLRGLYEISHSFAESLSLQATLDAVAKTMVDLFGADAAAIRMPDERGESLEVRAVHVADSKLAETAPTLLGPPQPMSAPTARALLRSGRPVLLEPGIATDDDAHRLLEPFLAQGSTAAVLPLATPGEPLGTLTLLSLDPARPLDRDMVDTAMTVAGQAALAIDNARLSQQQKDFSETMQHSLLPRALPALPGLEVGHVYESSARVDVGGDVYDFLTLDDGRLAVILGDVTGKGIQAAADMAMAKFTFRALARMHPEPEDFLTRANEVIGDEIGVGKFITMLYVLVDPNSRTVACASAGHPAAMLVRPDGTVMPFAGRGLALGIEPEQEYEAERAQLEPGSSIVLFTDGVLEARRDGELYGEERLDEILRRRGKLAPQELAEAIVRACRTFAGGDLGDDCAVVCLRLSNAG